MPYFIVWLKNNVDSRDDEPIKVKARNREAAENTAWDYTRGRFTVGRVFTMHEFLQADAWWHAQFWGKKAINE